MMTVLLRNLLEQVKDYDMTLIAGRNGLDRPVRWVHMVENQEIAGFLDGQEIAFATGIGLQTQEDLYDLVRSVYECDASGFVVNIGPYIHQISPETVRFCNDHDLPLFRVPWSVHMAQIMRVFCLSITMSEKHTVELAAALRNAISMPAREDLYLDYLEQSGFGKDWTYCVAVIDPGDATDPSSPPVHPGQGIAAGARSGRPSCGSTRARLERIVDSCIARGEWHAAQLDMDGLLTIVFAQYGAQEVHGMLAGAIAEARRHGADTSSVFVGVGKVTKSARCIGKSFIQARRLERLQKRRGRSGEPALYDESGVDRILLGVEDQSILRDYWDDSIGPLARYDAMNDDNLVATLRMYLTFNGSIKETAAHMFVHRNTVSYKLGKVESILGVRLSEYSTREFLSIGLQIGEIIDG